MSAKLRKILVLILFMVFVGCGIKLVMILDEYREADRIYSESRENYVVVETPPQLETEPPQEYFPDMSIDFEQLQEVNPEVAGWIFIPDTEVSYPVMKGEDNSHYLHYSYNNEYTNSGSIFIDYRNSRDLSDENTIIFGHNMKNGSMFGGLKKYKDQEFYDTHTEFYIFTPEEDYKYRIFSAYKTTSGGDSYDISFKDEEELREYTKLVLDQSLVKPVMEPGADERMVMLSTCTSTVWNERFVLHGVLIGVKDH